MGVWLREEIARGRKPDWLCVASDDSVGNVDDIADERPDLGLPTTTDPNEIADWLRRSGRCKIVFTTYQSSARLANAATEVGVEFDLAILDEAHRTTGARDRDFATLLHDKRLKVTHRLFMTATERKISGGNDGVLFSMDDDVKDYGARFYTMSFKEAIERRIITDVQASGRDLRRAKGKAFGYIVIPIIVPDDMAFHAFAESTEFKTIIKILAAVDIGRSNRRDAPREIQWAKAQGRRQAPGADHQDRGRGSCRVQESAR